MCWLIFDRIWLHNFVDSSKLRENNINKHHTKCNDIKKIMNNIFEAIGNVDTFQDYFIHLIEHVGII